MRKLPRTRTTSNALLRTTIRPNEASVIWPFFFARDEEIPIHLRILGTAAGGGFPQWNCRCRFCEASRRGLLQPRLQASLAVSADGSAWHIVNATPDITAQLLAWPALHPREGVRHTPFEGVLLTDGELDHTLGLLHLREGGGWKLHATRPVLEMLRDDFPVLPTLHHYVTPERREIEIGAPFELGSSDRPLIVEAFATGHDLPRYAAAGRGRGAVVGLMFEDPASGKRAAYAPGVADFDDALLETLATADAVFVDGTFWSEGEFPTVGGVPRTAKDMGHVPISGPSGSAARLRVLPAKLKQYVHINNTNPVLDPSSPQRDEIRSVGLDLANDGDEVEL